jgi:hydroxymethylpyrimidine/phosphomethylpyrimidine kinase
LIIAGSDSGGGAGIQADIKTVTMLGGHAMTAVTAITAQNTLGVQRVFPLPSDLVEQQFFSVVDDIGVDAIKIGMLGRYETVIAVRDLLYCIPDGIPIIIDPVMFATSGDALNESSTFVAMHDLFEHATLVTPNLPELQALGGETAILEHGCSLLVKGGHGGGDIITDRLLDASGEIVHWSDPRIQTISTHGTGCTLASAIATGLGQGMELRPAIARARLFVRAALEAAPGFGSGHGPMGHQAVRDL